MNRITVFLAALTGYMLVGCRHYSGHTSITLSESDHGYSMEADFPYGRTRDVEHYLDEKIGKESKMSFVNTKIDGQLSMDDHTIFYIKKIPGYIEVKLDKERNSQMAYDRIKTMCEGLKEVIGANAR